MFDAFWCNLVVWLITTAHIEIEHLLFFGGTIGISDSAIDIYLRSVVTLLGIITDMEFVWSENTIGVGINKEYVVSLLGIVFIIEVEPGIFLIF